MIISEKIDVANRNLSNTWIDARNYFERQLSFHREFDKIDDLKSIDDLQRTLAQSCLFLFTEHTFECILSR